jgi:hypothetical protein
MLQCNMQEVEVADCRVTPVNEKTSSDRSIAIQYLEAPACTAGPTAIFKGAEYKYLDGPGIPGH